MENNIINISNGYKAVVLPKDAENIQCIVMKQFNKEMELVKKWPIMTYTIDGELYEYHLKNESKLIGTLDTLTEEQAREICPMGEKQIRHILWGKGIKTENPLKKPEFNNCYDNGNFVDHLNKFSEWEASEREIKKVVIIKCKEQ